MVINAESLLVLQLSFSDRFCRGFVVTLANGANVAMKLLLYEWATTSVWAASIASS